MTRFDLPLLRAEFWRTRQIDFRWRECAVIDTMAIFHAQHPRDLSAVVQLIADAPFRRLMPRKTMCVRRLTIDVVRGFEMMFGRGGLYCSRSFLRVPDDATPRR